MQMQQGMAMMMQMQQMMQMMGGGGKKSAVDGSLDEYMKDQSQMSQMSNMMAQGMMDPNMMMAQMDPSMMMASQGPTIEQQIMEAKPMLKNMDTTTKKFIDTHCHIDVLFKKEQYDGDWETYVQNVAIEFPDSYDGCITSFCDPKLFSRKFAFKALESDKVWACFGCHPHHATFYNAEIEAQLEQFVKLEKVVAWGAIGLDYSDKYGKTDHDLQQAVFKRQCELAVQYEKPIVLQCRQAEADLFRILKEVVPKEHKIHRHCLNDKIETVQEMLEYYPNMYVGFTNVITNFNAKDARDAAQKCPIERMLIETDAPHFVPRTLRSDTFGGTTPVSMSHPGMALCVAHVVAQMQMKPIDEVIEVTRENARKVYGV